MRRSAIWAVLAAAAAHMLLFEMGPGGADGWSYYAITESIWRDFDLDLADNDYGISTFHVVGGRTVTKYLPGTSLMDGPFFLAARAAEPLAAGWKPDFGERGKSPPYDRVDGRVLVRILAVSLAHNVFTLLGMLFTWRALRVLGYADGPAVWAAALSLFASPMVFYAMNGMSEAPSFLLSALVLWLLARVWHDPFPRERTWAALGLAAGLSLLVHYRNGLLLAAAGLSALAIRAPIQERLFRAARVALGAACLLWIVPVYNHVQWGEAATIYADEPFHNPFRFGAPLNIWLSDQHGLVWFHPAYLLAIAGICMLLRKKKTDETRNPEPRTRGPGPGTKDPGTGARKAIGWIAAAMFFVHCTVCGTFHEWSGPGGFSHHYLTPLFPFLAVGFAALLARCSSPAWRVAAAAGAAWTYALFLLSLSRMVYDSDGSGLGLSILDYRLVWTEGIPLGTVLDRIVASSHVLKALF